MRTRHLLPLIAASVGLVLAGCGSDDTGTGSTTEGTSAATDTTTGGPGADALAYAKCMRDHGVDFPDPVIGADGSVRVTADGASADDPDMPEAEEACADLLQRSGQGTDVDAEREAEVQEQALAFAQCMRENGFPEFPDPQVDGGRVIMGGPGGGGAGGDPNSPEFQAAQQTCQGSSGLGSGTQP